MNEPSKVMLLAELVKELPYARARWLALNRLNCKRSCRPRQDCPPEEETFAVEGQIDVNSPIRLVFSYNATDAPPTWLHVHLTASRDMVRRNKELLWEMTAMDKIARDGKEFLKRLSSGGAKHKYRIPKQYHQWIIEEYAFFVSLFEEKSTGLN